MSFLTPTERTYLLRAIASADGCLRPDSKLQQQVCESLVSKGMLVRVEGNAYATPEVADALGLTRTD